MYYNSKNTNQNRKGRSHSQPREIASLQLQRKEKNHRLGITSTHSNSVQILERVTSSSTRHKTVSIMMIPTDVPLEGQIAGKEAYYIGRRSNCRYLSPWLINNYQLDVCGAACMGKIPLTSA